MVRWVVSGWVDDSVLVELLLVLNSEHCLKAKRRNGNGNLLQLQIIYTGGLQVLVKCGIFGMSFNTKIVQASKFCLKKLLIISCPYFKKKNDEITLEFHYFHQHS